MSASPFQLSLGTARHGWLPIAVQVGSHFGALDASRVLNDPLKELVELAVALVEPGTVQRVVRIWEEPAWIELRFASQEDSSSLAIEWYESGKRELIARAIAARADVAQTIVTVLAAFERSLPPTSMVEGWGEFDSRAFRRAHLPCPAKRSLLPPWFEVLGLQRLVDELRAEVGSAHPLSGVEVALVARREDNDDCLFEVLTELASFSWTPRYAASAA